MRYMLEIEVHVSKIEIHVIMRYIVRLRYMLARY